MEEASEECLTSRRGFPLPTFPILAWGEGNYVRYSVGGVHSPSRFAAAAASPRERTASLARIAETW